MLQGKPETLWGSLVLVEQLLGLSFGITPQSFFQVNTRQAAVLYEDIVVLDPPAKGAAAAVLAAILKASPRRIVYVSCDPATLSRDLQRLLAEGGYRIEYIQPVDLFPQTAHVESIVLMTNCGLKGK